jgi:hypothetical protein
LLQAAGEPLVTTVRGVGFTLGRGRVDDVLPRP